MDAEHGLVGGQVEEVGVAFAGFRIVDHSVSMAEGATLGVLSTDADGGAVEEETAKGQRFSHAPVDAAVFLESFEFGFHLPEDLFVYIKAFGEFDVLFDDVMQGVVVDVGLVSFKAIGWLLNCVGLGEGIARDILLFFDRFKGAFHALSVGVFKSLDFLCGEFAILNQLCGERAPDRLHFCDGLIKHGLGEGGFIGFIMSVFAPAVHIDDDITAKSLSVIEGGFHGSDDGKGVVAVNVEYGGFHYFCDVCAVTAGSRVGWGGGKTDLVIDDNMNGATGTVAL